MYVGTGRARQPLTLLPSVRKHQMRRGSTGGPRPETIKNIVMRDTPIYIVDT